MSEPLKPVVIGSGGRINPDAKPSRREPESPPEPPKRKRFSLKPRPSVLSTLSELAGIAAISSGCWLIYHPSGLIMGGIGLIAVGVAAGLDE